MLTVGVEGKSEVQEINNDRDLSSVVSEVLVMHATSIEKVLKKKFDSCASIGVTGDENRLEVVLKDDDSPRQMIIKAFNGTASSPLAVGLNEDGMKEYYVPQMPRNLVLLCAHAYASQGAAILTKDGGVVIKLSQSELEELLEFIKRYPVTKRLVVNNRTYEIDESSQHVPSDENEVQLAESSVMSNTAKVLLEYQSKCFKCYRENFGIFISWVLFQRFI